MCVGGGEGGGCVCVCVGVCVCVCPRARAPVRTLCLSVEKGTRKAFVFVFLIKPTRIEIQGRNPER